MKNIWFKNQNTGIAIMYVNSEHLIGQNQNYLQANMDFCNFYFNSSANNEYKLPTVNYGNFWSHIELGAANYGLEGHTKTSQQKTVLMEFSYVSNQPNYVDTLPDKDKEPYNPRHQFAVLFDTLDQLVHYKGKYGIFHVNDLFADYSNYAAEQLNIYARSKGYNDVIIESIPGDYVKINPHQTLEKYGKFLYDNVHLKNPELSFYNYGIDGDKLLSNDTTRFNARMKLQKLADLSHSGMYFFPIDFDNNFIPKAEEEEFISKNIFYHATHDYQPVAYYFPEGPILPKIYGKVYWIDSSYTCTES